MTFDPILLVDDETDGRSAMTRALENSGFPVEIAMTGNEALKKFRRRRFSMIIADAGTPDLSGMEVLCKVKKWSPDTPVIMVTASGSVNHAVEAMQAGASDYILKPFSSDTLKAAVKRACVDLEPSGRPDDAGCQFQGAADSKQMIAQDPQMLKILMLAKNVASSKATILIQGESGTGKEVLAAFIHHHSGRRNQPFVALNCAALPDSLAESELFGHEKGAFTGAFTRKAGKFELAHEGTLLLDEISELSTPLQAKLLRVLQEQEVDRIGGCRPVPIDTRVIAVSNVDLRKAVTAGDFREDLFYRVNVVPLVIPPLRERKDDIPMLARYFLKKYNAMNGRRMNRVADETMARLLSYHWRGNVRELENVVERAVLLGDGDVMLPEHLMLETVGGQEGRQMQIRAGMSVREMEKNLICQTLKSVNDNRTQAAELLGISIRTLRNKLKEYRENVGA